MQIKVKAEELEMKIEDETYIVTVRDWGDTIRGYFTSLLECIEEFIYSVGCRK